MFGLVSIWCAGEFQDSLAGLNAGTLAPPQPNEQFEDNFDREASKTLKSTRSKV